ncbi:unnamed protein product [Echinostoma caproni]|uniref:Uncharacterized protein n=1 Tax=Echinostoma caproni TaxID=27848 RepID=A0A183AJ47_9TREM|nr:unnamed protein product [Echinostoma caproni]
MNRIPSYPVDEPRDRRSNSPNRQHLSNQSNAGRRDWAALFNRPLFIIMIVAFVLLFFTGIIFITLFAMCRRQRAHRKPRSQVIGGFRGPSQSYANKECNERDREARTIKLPAPSWTPSAVIYQPTG